MKVGIRDKEGYLITFDSPDEQAEVDAAFDEMKWHIGNLLAELEAVKDNRFRTLLLVSAAEVIMRSYRNAISSYGSKFERPNYRLDVEWELRNVDGIDHYADILPRHKVRGVASGNGIFELKEDVQ